VLLVHDASLGGQEASVAGKDDGTGSTG
jgi:hypothetical protein